MDFNFDMDLVQSQKLILTPQLKQALEILKMNSQELADYVDEQIEENPVIELEEEELTPEEENIVSIEQVDWESLKHSDKKNEYEVLEDIDEFSYDTTVNRVSLKDHLLFQLHTSDLGRDDFEIGEFLIENTDENGYLLIDTNDAAAYFNISSNRVKSILAIIQTFDPPGVCARSLKECLLIQLSNMDNLDSNIIKIVEHHLDDLASNKVKLVAKSTGLDPHKVEEIFDFVKTLEPKPGRGFSSEDDVKFIIPDITVREIKGKFDVLINEDSIPLININQYYKKIILQDISIETKKYIQNKIDSARWIIKCIEQRKNTIRRIAECIVDKQQDFFSKGKSHIRPLTMKAVALDADMHESTVSRAVAGKYIQCRWGIFEMRYFFSGGLISKSGDEISDKNIKVKLQEIVKAENKKSPLSDSKIADAFKESGIDISRRTIAKYRAEINIPSAAKRRRI